MKGWWDMWLRLNLISRIAVGLVLGVLVGAAVQGTAVAPQVGTFATLIGGLFVGALRSVAPVLVFLLVISAIARHRQGTPTHIRPIFLLFGGDVSRRACRGDGEFPVSVVFAAFRGGGGAAHCTGRYR